MNIIKKFGPLYESETVHAISYNILLVVASIWGHTKIIVKLPTSNSDSKTCSNPNAEPKSIS